MTSFDEDPSYAQWRQQRMRRQRMIALIVIFAMALPGGLAVWSLIT